MIWPDRRPSTDAESSPQHAQPVLFDSEAAYWRDHLHCFDIPVEWDYLWPNDDPRNGFHPGAKRVTTLRCSGCGQEQDR